MNKVLYLGAAGLFALSVAACGPKPSAIAPEGQASYAPPASTTAGSSSSTANYASRAPAPLFEGKPMWAANRRHSAEENAQFQFTRNGGDFGARSEDDYVAKAHAFVDRPPSGAEVIERRNGDRLIYDRRANTFAVASRDGAPRTMFKPRDGASYWAQQKDREAKRPQGRQTQADES
jgi:hypothetical protein